MDKEIRQEDLNELKTQAADFLKSGLYFAASQLYLRLLKVQPDSKDLHIGSLLAKNSLNQEDKLIGYYQDLFNKPEYEILLGCEPDNEHIQDVAEKNELPSYLEKEEILKAYQYDLSYKSDLFSRRKEKEKILKLIENDDDLRWLRENGFNEINEILKVYDKRIDESEIADRNSSEQIRNDYQRFLYKTYADVRELNRKARDRKEKDYQDLLEVYRKSEDVDELRKLIFDLNDFVDYKEGERYISLCEKKIEQLKQKALDEDHEKKIRALLDEAKLSLIKDDFSDAYDRFTQIVSLDKDNEEARLGILMARTKTKDADELFAYYKDLYSSENEEILKACEEDNKHIEEMCEKYYLPDLLEKEEIREKYFFDLTYPSLLSDRIRQQSRFKDEIGGDPLFGWLKTNGSKQTKKRIDDLYDHFENNVREAREADKKKSEQIRNDYQRFLFKTYAEIKKLHKQANDKKSDNYRNLIRSYELSSDIYELEELIERFKELGDFKECERYINLCQKKIRDLKDREKAFDERQEVETALIAGRAYLASGNTKLANESFNNALSLDPEDPQAYLGILMIETGCRNVDELKTYYKELYNEDTKDLIEACKEDRSHIDAMADRYYLPSYLDKETIRKYYGFDRTFKSSTKARMAQKEQLLEEFRMNPLLAKVFGKGDKDIEKIFNEIKDVYDLRISRSKNEDEKQKESVRHIYDIYLKESDKTLEKIYEEKLREKDEDDYRFYQANIAEFNKDLSEEELEKLCQSFDKDYKDSAEYIEKCKERIRNIRVSREKETLDALLEVGNGFLARGLYEQAKERFESYLNIDPESEEANLAYLMASTENDNIDDLFEYYKNLYADEILVNVEAVEEDSKHIDDMVSRCYLEDLFEKHEIRSHYDFDRTYDSLSETRIQQKKQIEDEIASNPSLSFLSEKGSARIREYFKELLETYDNRIEEAEEEDEYLKDTIRKSYRSFLRSSDKEVRSIYNSRLKERNQQLKKADLERKEALRKAKEEAEQERKDEEALKSLEKEAEKERKALEAAQISQQKQEAEELKRREKEARDKQRLEKQAQDRAEKERLKQERKQEAELRKAQRKAINLPKPNIGIVAAVISLTILAIVTYRYWYVPNSKYNNAVSLLNNGQFDEAILAFDELGDYKDSVYMAKESQYKKAEDLYEKGELIAAANSFNGLRFDDSEDRIKSIKKRLMEKADVGDIILFGDYEQDGNYDNGKEMLEWIVLEKQEGSILVLSLYGIDAQQFNATSERVYWDNSTLRSWLNGRFPDNAFSGESPSAVLQTTLLNYRYPEDLDEDADLDEIIMEEYETRDRLFLLSDEEAERYFENEEDRICLATAYAIENGVAASSEDHCTWWLRTSSEERDDTILVIRSADGSIGTSMLEIVNAVRPAMWLKLD